MEEIKNNDQELKVVTEGLLISSKSEISDRARNAIKIVQSGEVDKVDAYIYAKKGLQLFTELCKGLKPIAEGVQLNKGFTRFNTEFVESMQGVSYDYSECGDVIYEELLAKQEALKEEIKNREKFLQTIVKPTEVYNPETTELYQVQPPIKKGSLGYTIKIK